MGILTSAKKAALQVAAKIAVQHAIRPVRLLGFRVNVYGQIGNHEPTFTIAATVQPPGMPPLVITASNVEFINGVNGGEIRVGSLAISTVKAEWAPTDGEPSPRPNDSEWPDALLDRFLPSRRVPVPSGLIKALREAYL